MNCQKDLRVDGNEYLANLKRNSQNFYTILVENTWMSIWSIALIWPFQSLPLSNFAQKYRGVTLTQQEVIIIGLLYLQIDVYGWT
jgi:hypothetical protein